MPPRLAELISGFAARLPQTERAAIQRELFERMRAVARDKAQALMASPEEEGAAPEAVEPPQGIELAAPRVKLVPMTPLDSSEY